MKAKEKKHSERERKELWTYLNFKLAQELVEILSLPDSPCLLTAGVLNGTSYYSLWVEI